MRAVLLTFALVFGFNVGAQAAEYKVDPSHTSILFKVSHLGFSNTYGMFPNAEGMIKFDEVKPENSSLEVSVKVADVNTHDKKRDDHLRGPDFFNAKQFPKITVKSKSFKKISDKKYEVVADFNMHGETKTMTFVFDLLKTGKDPWGNSRIGAETKFTVKRSDFKMTYMNKPGELGDDVEMVVSMEGVKK